MVTRQPVTSSLWSNRGNAVISLDLSSTAIWPNARPWAVAHALTVCRAGMSPSASWDRRSVLPSSATTSPGRTRRRSCSQCVSIVATASGSKSPMTRSHVPWDGMPCGNSSHCANQASWSLPNSSVPTRVLTPPMQAQMVRHSMSESQWCTPRGSLGSSISCTQSRKGVGGVAFMAASLCGPNQILLYALFVLFCDFAVSPFYF